MPIDPQIPLGIQTPNPLAALQQPIQTASGLQSLKQNQMRLNANQAISSAYAQSVDPNTGEVDFNKLQALASQNGAGAFLPEGMTLDQYEQAIIREALNRANGNKSQAARMLGLTRNALRYRLQQMGMEA